MTEITSEILIDKHPEKKINDDVDLNINREFEIDIKETDVLIDQAQPSNHKPPSILQLLFHLSGKKELCLMFFGIIGSILSAISGPIM